jgi:nickel transport protein
MKYLWVLAVLASGFIFPCAAAAHGVEVSEVTGQHGIRTVRFTYTDGTSMLFAKIKVFPPSSPDVPAQESIADRDGYFSFIPFENGSWRLTAQDGMGHKGEIVVTVATETEAAAADTAKAASAGKLPRLFGIVLGLSLILNIFALWHFVGGRKKGTAHAH